MYSRVDASISPSNLRAKIVDWTDSPIFPMINPTNSFEDCLWVHLILQLFVRNVVFTDRLLHQQVVADTEDVRVEVESSLLPELAQPLL